MNSVFLKRVATVIALGSIPFLLGCGKSEPPTGSPQPPYVGGPGGGSPACIPLSNGVTIGFTGSNVHFLQPFAYSGAGELAAGAIPPNSQNLPFSRFGGQSFGSVSVLPGGVASGGPLVFSGRAVNDFGVQEGGLSVNVSPIQQGGGVYDPTGGGLTGNAAISGTFQITNLNSGYNAPSFTPNPYYPTYPQPNYPTPPAPSGCVTGLAMALNLTGNTIYMSQVYLYLNGTNHGLWFKIRSY